MGELKVLRPQTLITDSRRRSNPNRPRPNHRNNSLPANNNLVMGQVKILRRGEDPPPPSAFEDRSKPVSDPKRDRKKKEEEKKKKKKAVGFWEEELCSLSRLGPDPEMVPRQTKFGGFFSGSMVEAIESPPASCLPLPHSLLLRRAV